MKPIGTFRNRLHIAAGFIALVVVWSAAIGRGAAGRNESARGKGGDAAAAADADG